MPCCTRAPHASGEPTCCRGEVFGPVPVLVYEHSIVKYLEQSRELFYF